MTKKSTPQSGLFTPRALIALLVCAAAVCSILAGTLPATAGKLAFFRAEGPAKISQRTLTFQERVAYQRAIEEVYWRHRIWPKERHDPKPSVDAVMSQAQLEKKVQDYLRESQALEDYWQRPITSEELQAEMDCMAKRTRQPEVLRELFEGLGNDPFVIAECLARPLLAERNSARLASRNGRLNSSWLRAEKDLVTAIPQATAGYKLPIIADGTECIDDTWTATSIQPLSRFYHTAVWTGSEMIIWGGSRGGSPFNTGARYTPSTDSWTATSQTNVPDARAFHTAIWTGSEMIIWGGFDSLNSLNTGGRYNPASNSWIGTTTTFAPSPRWGHTAVWAGSEMIVWGGFSTPGGNANTGGRYNSITDSWTATSTANVPDGREYHTAVWTGSEMIVWGGTQNNGIIFLNTGGRYNPSTDSWTATTMTNAPNARDFHTAVWSGNEMIVWGGIDENFFDLNTGGRYNPNSDSWTATSIANAPTPRAGHTAVWTDSEMIVWGGNPSVTTGGRYNPSTDAWIATSTTNAPAGRNYHTAVWTGSEMIIWGGRDDQGNSLDTGGRYCAQTRATPTPRPRPSPHPRP